MADRYLLESGAPDGYLLEDSSGVNLLEDGMPVISAQEVLKLPVRRPKQGGHVQVTANLLTTTLAVITTVLVARDPLVTKRPTARAAQQPQAANLLTNTLAPPAQAPFVNEPELPTFGKRVPQNIVQHNLLTTSLTQLEMPLRSQYDPDQLFRKPPAQQVDYPNLQATTLAIVIADPVEPQPWVNQPRGKLPTQPDYTANLTTTSFYVPDDNLAREATYTPRVLKVQRQQPTYFNLPPGEDAPVAPDYYFLNDSGFTVTIQRKAIQQPSLNTLPLLTAVAPTLPPRSQDLPQPQERAHRVQDIGVPNLLGTTLASFDYYFLNDSGFAVPPRAMPRQQTTHNTLALLTEPQVDYYVLNDSGFMLYVRIPPRQQTTHSALSLLTFTPPTLPPVSQDLFQLPKVALIAPQDTSQGQNPDSIPPPVEVVEPDPTQKPAGRKKHRKRYQVDIDGQIFEVGSAAEAIALLNRAREIAALQAEQKAAIAVKRLRSKERVPQVIVKAPVITVSAPIAAEAAYVIADIERLYRQAAETAELRLLLIKQRRAEEDDDDELLLLH